MYISFVYGYYRANLSKIFEVPHSSKRKHYQSKKRSKRFGNFAGEYVWFAFYMYNAKTHASPLENCIQLKTKLLMFILSIGHFFDIIFTI